MKSVFLFAGLAILTACASGGVENRRLASEPSHFVAELDLLQAADAYTKKCDDKPEGCFITECDAGIVNCQADHVLLFRGVTHYWPSVDSGLKRTCDEGVDFCAHFDAAQAIKAITDALAPLRPMGEALPEDHEIILVRDSATKKSKWVHRYNSDGLDDMKSVYRGLNLKKKQKPLTLMQILFTTHQAGSFLEYLAGKEIVSLDAFISFSADPNVAIEFGGRTAGHVAGGIAPEPPRAIVLTVGPKSFTKACGEKPIPVGAVLKPEGCGEYNAFNEVEYPVFFQVNQADILGDYALSPQTLARKMHVMGCDDPNEYSWQCMCRRYPQTCPAPAK